MRNNLMRRKMNDYWLVIEKSTGRVISHCGEEKDAIMMLLLDKDNRIYRKQNFIIDQVIDVSSTTNKQLPGQQGLPEGQPFVLESEKIRLPEGEGKPINI